jgi:D-aspartate ligase
MTNQVVLPKPLAIVVGTGLNALGVVRSLAAGEVPVVVLGPADGPAMCSRFGRKVALAETDGDELISALRREARDKDALPMVFLTEEKSVETISERRAEILGSMSIRLPEDEIVRTLLDKVRFQAVAEEAGNPIPAAHPLRSMEDLGAIAKLRYPCVLKPAWKNYDYGARFKKAYVVGSIEEVEQQYREIMPIMPDMIVQEWIEGEDSDIYFCLQYLGRGGELVASFTGRKLRSWPPRIGGTASCIAAPDYAQQLSDATLRFFQHAGFEGMGSMEYKRDRRDGRFYMIEPTVGRTDFQEEVATINGVNIPLAAYSYEALQKRLAQPMTSTPLIWRDAQIDRWSRECGANPEGDINARIRKVDAYFRVSDPMPWVTQISERARAKAFALLRRS